MTLNKVDFAIITALPEELEAMLSKLGDCKREFMKPLHLCYASLGRSSVVATCSGERGVKAASTATTLLERYQPTYLLFVGIAAGFESAKVRLGDVVVAEACHYDGPGKDMPTGKWSAHEQVLTSAELFAFSQNYHRLDWKDLISINSPTGGFQPKVHHGLIASSETVVASKAKMERLLQEHRKLRALAQEGYGVAKVAHERKIDFLEIRGICDFGDESKNDDWHDYAAHVAAAYAVGLLRYIEVTYKKPIDFQDSSGLTAPEAIDIGRLPRPSTELVGRQEELRQIQQAFLNPKTYLTVLVAAGGIGKSALTDAWLKQLRPHYHGVQRVFAWSFYSQGSHNTQTSSVPFFQEALPFFGWSGELPKEDVAKGRALAKLLAKQSFLLILDGLEPLQQPAHILDGELKDTALQAFFEEVRLYGFAQSPSLILISSRQPLVELQEWETECFVAIDLQTLPTADGVKILRHLEVQGTDQELAQATEDMGGHALALVLLGKLLKEQFAGRIERRDQLPPLWKERKQGGHALRVLQFYAERYWQANTPELAFLQLLGLLDRPMTLREKAVLVAQADCAEPLRALDDVGWELLERHLEDAGLLNHPQPLLEKEGSDRTVPLRTKDGSGVVGIPLLAKEGLGVVGERYHWDCHPLIRDYFGQRFQDSQPDLFRQAHRVLFDYYQSVPAKHQPDSLEELDPLYRAVVHGCLAGEYYKALDEVYRERIVRGKEHYSQNKLGAYSQDLTALAAFFPHGWSQPVQHGLSEADQAWLLAAASFCLMSLGRLGEAVAPREAGIKIEVNRQDWNNASRSAQTLIDLYLPLGQLAKAATVARQGIQYAEQSGDLFMQMGSHAYLATTLHRQGQLDLAQQSFQRAEQLQQEQQPKSPLYSLRGFQYCALLLDQAQSVAEYEAVLGRGKYTLKIGIASNHLLTIALDHLTIARVFTQLQRYDEAVTAFDQAVTGIRKANQMLFLPVFLIDRANFHCQRLLFEYLKSPLPPFDKETEGGVTQQLENARRDLQEADSLIRRCGMKLYAVDCQLAWCRYYLKQSQPAKARTCWQHAKDLIAITGYHLRDKEQFNCYLKIAQTYP